MAKTGKIKKKAPTLHSRAARRAASPSINLDKSITRTSPPLKSAPVLGARSAGITKKSKAKPLKRQQRIRQLNAFERAEVVIDKLQNKVAKSVGKEKRVIERRKGWDEVNVDKRKLLGKKGNAFGALEDGGTEGREREWVSDEEMPEADGGSGEDDHMVDGVATLAEISGEVKQVIVPETIPLPDATAEEDELL